MRRVLSDATGSLPIVGDVRPLAAALAAAPGQPVVVTLEWTPHGVQPRTLHLADRTVDVGHAAPTNDGSARGPTSTVRSARCSVNGCTP